MLLLVALVSGSTAMLDDGLGEFHLLEDDGLAPDRTACRRRGCP
jgi:hypothetical protein